MSETVDILMATYKTNLCYLKQQIESILNQTYQDFRLLISDDHSEQEELDQCINEFKQRDSRIYYIKQPQNIGYIRNFEFLLTQSTAKYICFCDHDDIWYPQKIEKCLTKLKEDQVDLVYCNAEQINEKNEVIQKNYFMYKNMPLVKGKNQILGISRYLGIRLFTTDNQRSKRKNATIYR